MNKQEFMARLESLLDGIPEEEKREALAFYTSYFEDAGIENEESILKELESPEQVAETIRANLGEPPKEEQTSAAEGVGTADGAHHFTADWENPGNDMGSGAGNAAYYGGNGQTGNPGVSDRGVDSSRMILIVLLVVLTSPIWIGVLGGVFGVVCGIFFGTLGVMLGCLISGPALFGIGISLCTGGLFAAGIVTVGVGLLLLAMGLLTLLLFVLICSRFIPWLARGIVSLAQRLLYGRKEVQIR
ncbi:MAG: DUF1700 domain-containing protein [Lachnospiraceae bacterium]|nr:DUF1700 domain-containing protein [Lachnospiraceae bacterium]